MRSHTIVRWFAVAGAASLLITACSHGDNGAKSGPKRATIDSIMGVPDYSDADRNAPPPNMEELVAKCMIGQGWEYIPVTYPDGDGTRATGEDQLKLIKREGLGIAYNLLNEPDNPFANFVDPNVEYVSTLSESEHKAYDNSLSGTEEENTAAMYTEVNPDTGEEEQTQNGPRGCIGKAYDEVYANNVTMSPGYSVAMQGYFADLHQRVASDPRMVKFQADWSTCMKKASFDYETVQDFWMNARTEFQTRADAVIGSGFQSQPMDGWSDAKVENFLLTASADEIDAMMNPPRTLTADQRSTLEAILADEITLGVAEYACSHDVPETADEIYSQIEEAYALEHQDELEALAASLLSGK